MSKYEVKESEGVEMDLFNFIRLAERLKKAIDGKKRLPKLDNVAFSVEQVTCIERLFEKRHTPVMDEWYLGQEVKNRKVNIKQRVVVVEFDREEQFVDRHGYGKTEKMFNFELHEANSVKKGECGEAFLKEWFMDNPIYDLRIKEKDNE